MRFSLTTIWMGLKLRLLLASLVFAIGFYFGLIHHVFGHAFWPGVYTLAGLLFFTGTGVLLGLNGPDVWRHTSSAIKPFFPSRPRHPYYLARTALALLTLIVFVATLAGSFITLWLIRFVLHLPESFLLGPLAWKSLLFGLPALPAVSLGVILGLTLDLAFALVVLIETPEPLHANRPRTQNTIRSLLALIVIALSAGWPVGFCLAGLHPDRWLELILIPMIICLLVLLVTLLENPKHFITHTTFPTDNFFEKTTPELASSPSTLSSLIVVVLASFAVWQIIHWSFALTNWCGSAITFSNNITILEIVLLAGTSAAAGIFFGPHLIPQPLNQFLAILDRQGLSLAVLGIVSVITTTITNQTMKASFLQTLVPFSIVPLLFIILAFLWGVSLGLALPGLAIGRPDRFDLWLEVIGKISLGSLLIGPLYLIWQLSNLGNLLALSAGSLLAIAIGGVALIYDTPVVSINRRESRTGRVIHTTSIFGLYFALFFILLSVPSLKSGWLKTINNPHMTISEGLGGAACITHTPSPSLTWAGQYSLSERFDPNLRQEACNQVNQIVANQKQTFYLPLRLLLVNLPYLDEKSLSNMNGRTICQVDIDQALRDSELTFHSLQSTTTSSDLEFSDLAYHRGHYNLIITFLPTCWPGQHAWPHPSILLKRLVARASNPTALRFVSIVSERKFNQEMKKIESLKHLLKRQTGIDFELTSTPSQTGDRWILLAPAQ